MRIDIWSDVVCPWCYIGKRRLEAALEGLEGLEVEIHWRSFELDPAAPARLDIPLDELLARKYRMSLDQARAARERVTAIAAEEGLTFRLEAARTGNTFDAHRLIHFARSHGLDYAMKERLLSAYFCESLPVADRTVLAGLAAEVGLDRAETEAALASDAFGAEVRADEREARVHGATGVPFFVFDRRFAVSGAQTADVLRHVLERAAETRVPEGPTCDDECALP